MNKGDVVVISKLQTLDYVFAIFNKFDDNGTLHFYAELNPITGDLYFPFYDYGFSYDMDKITYRLATDLEKNKLYSAFYSYFTEDYDCEWRYHFTDSSYFDILDCLLEALCIHVSEKDDWDYPEFVQDIRNYIWDTCCKVLDVKNDIIECKDEDKPKMVRLDDVCNWIENHIFDFPWYDNEQGDFSSKDVANALRKAMEE